VKRGAILVTGGAGYVGSHVVLSLQSRHPVVVLDNLSEGHRELVPEGVVFEAGDVLNRAALSSVFQRHVIAGVVHLAARAYVGESAREPARYFENNLVGTFQLLEAMRAHGVREFVFSSTCAVYGAPSRLPIGEDAALAPINAYGESKLAIERMLHWYGAAYGVRAVVLRYFNAAGADAAGRSGEWHEPEPHLIPQILAAAAGGEALTLHGDDYATPDGTGVRDFIHVSDLARAHAQALDYLAAGEASACLNLGTGRGLSVGELIAAAARITGQEVLVQRGPRRAGDPAALIADASRAERVLSWRPCESDANTLLATAWAWRQAPKPHSATPRAAASSL
jgi:UDP-glucose-4-epimerase GalE